MNQDIITIFLLAMSSTMIAMEIEETANRNMSLKNIPTDTSPLHNDVTDDITEENVTMVTMMSDVTSGGLPLLDYPVMQKSAWILNRIRLCFLYPVGVATGILTIIVLSRPAVRSSNVTPFLIFIAVMDFLYNGFLTAVSWIPHASNHYCRAMWHIIFGVSHISDWAITSVAAIRALAVAIPHKVKIIITGRTTIIVLTTIVVLENGIELLSSLSAYYPTYDFCINIPVDLRLSRIYGYFTAVNKVIMAVILTISTLVIIHKLRNRHESTNSGHQGTQVAKMLVSICILFIVTQIPGSAFFASTFQVDFMERGPYHKALFNVLLELFALLKAVNHMGNLFLYCISAEVFRSELLATLRCRTRATSTTSLEMNTSSTKKTEVSETEQEV